MFSIFKKVNRPSKPVSDQYRRTASVLSFNHDGLEIARTRKTARWLPVWHIIFFIYIGLLIRLVAMAEAGPTAYAQRMDTLENGSFIERSVAWIMHMDPVSRVVANNIRSGLRKLNNI